MPVKEEEEEEEKKKRVMLRRVITLEGVSVQSKKEKEVITAETERETATATAAATAAATATATETQDLHVAAVESMVKDRCSVCLQRKLSQMLHVMMAPTHGTALNSLNSHKRTTTGKSLTKMLFKRIWMRHFRKAS